MLDLEKARDLKSSPHWEGVVGELDFRIGLLTKELLACPPEKLQELQIQIRTYQLVKNLPDAVIGRLE